MRFLVIGAGAVGGYFGGRLAEAGRDVSFLVRPARAEQLRAEGLQVLSPHGDFTIRPKLLTAPALTEPFDVVLLSLKAYQLKAALDDFAPGVGPETMILPVLNGMAHMDTLAERFGGALIGGAARIAAQLEDGKVRQFAPMQSILYGELSGERTERIERLDQAMTGAGFDAALSTTIVQDMWEKWAFLACLGAATCLLKGSIGEIVASEEGRRTVEALLEECRSIPAACGQALRPAAAASMTAMMTAQGSTLTSSMYRDMVAAAPVEVEEIIVDYVRRGEAKGAETPLLRAAAAALRLYEARRSA